MFHPGCRRTGSDTGDGSSGEKLRLEKRYAELRRQEMALSAEYALAKAYDPYLVVDLARRSVELKARGRSLRSAEIVDFEVFPARGAAAIPWTLTERKSLQEVERPQIAPGAGEDAVAEAALKAQWGPQYMPIDYDLLCGQGRAVQIRSLYGEASRFRAWKNIASAYRRLVDWFREKLLPGYSRPGQGVKIWLSKENSQLIFWSLPKNIRILILP